MKEDNSLQLFQFFGIIKILVLIITHCCVWSRDLSFKGDCRTLFQDALLPKLNKYWGFLIVSAVLGLLFVLPFVGGVVKFAVVLFGLGVISVYCLEKYQNQQVEKQSLKSKKATTK